MRRLLFVLLAVTAVLVATVAVAAPKKPAITVEDKALTEPAGTPQDASVQIALSRKTRRTLRLKVVTRDGTATAGADYQAVSRTVKIKKGRKTGRFRVPILPDELVEGDETFDVVVRKVRPKRRARIEDGEATVTIAASDGGMQPTATPTPSPTPTASPSPTAEPCEHGTPETFEDLTPNGDQDVLTRSGEHLGAGCTRWYRHASYYRTIQFDAPELHVRFWAQGEDAEPPANEDAPTHEWDVVESESGHFGSGFIYIAVDAGGSDTDSFDFTIDRDELP